MFAHTKKNTNLVPAPHALAILGYEQNNHQHSKILQSINTDGDIKWLAYVNASDLAGLHHDMF